QIGSIDNLITGCAREDIQGVRKRLRRQRSRESRGLCIGNQQCSRQCGCDPRQRPTHAASTHRSVPPHFAAYVPIASTKTEIPRKSGTSLLRWVGATSAEPDR